MIVECPKCHFKQPKDQFCAQCGVNMLLYSPPQKSFFEKLVQNSTALFIVGLIVISTSSYIYLHNSRSQKVFNSLKSKTVFVVASRSTLDEDKTTELNNNNNNNETPPLKESPSSRTSLEISTTKPSSQLPKAPPSAHTAHAVQTAGTVPSEKNPHTVQLLIQYAEVTEKGYEFLASEARASGQFNVSDYSQGVIGQGATKIKTHKEDIKVYSEEKKSLTLNKEEIWFQGLKSSNILTQVGLTQSLKITQIEADKIFAELKINKRFQIDIQDTNNVLGSGAVAGGGNNTVGSNNNSNKSFDSIDYLGTIEIVPEQIYFIANVLTSKPIMSQQEYLTSITPFEILKSSSFKINDTISLFFYQFQQ